MNLSSMKVSTKFYLGFSVPLLLMLLIVAISIFELGRIENNLEQIVTVNSVRRQLASDAAQKVRDVSTGIREIFLAREDKKKGEIKNAVAAASAEYAELLKKAEEMTGKDDAKGRELFAKFKAAQVAVAELNNQAIDMATAFRDGEGIELVQTKAGPAVATMIDAIDQIIAHQIDQSKIRYDESRKTYDIARLLMLFFGAAATLLGALIAFFITRSITGPLNRVIAGLTDGAGQVSSAAGQVSSASQSLAEGTSEQASSLEETSSSLEEMSSMTKQNADNANQAKVMMTEARQIVQKVDRHMKDMAGAVAEITRSSEETGKIIKTIDEIAFQTNLLALNAAVEAARAGEAGAGFAVVADEVRNLAMRASEAAKNTNSLIENTIKAVRKGNELTSATQEAFKENAEIAQKIGQLVDEIAAASGEQSHGITQVNMAVAEMDKVTQSTAANAEESAAAAEELNAQAEQMKVFVEDLVQVVGGKGNGASSKWNGGGLQRSPATAREGTALPEKEASRQLADSGRKSGKVARPEEVIPMGDEGFKDF